MSLAPPRDSKTYLEVQDSHQYVASPSIVSQLLVMVGHMSNQYTVKPNKDIFDDALMTLKKKIAKTSQIERSGPLLITNTEDPEMQKKRAEAAEKERIKAQRRLDLAVDKESRPSGRRTGGGLNLDDLEGRPGRRVPPGRKSGPKRTRNRRDYSSEEEQGGRGREDKYDVGDGFLVDSDEDVEEDVEDSEGEEEEESEEERPKAKKQKKSQPEITSDDDAPADLEDIDAPVSEPVAGGRGRKRNIVEDDEDE